MGDNFYKTTKFILFKAFGGFIYALFYVKFKYFMFLSE